MIQSSESGLTPKRTSFSETNQPPCSHRRVFHTPHTITSNRMYRFPNSSRPSSLPRETASISQVAKPGMTTFFGTHPERRRTSEPVLSRTFT